MILAEISNVPPGSSLGYTLLAAGVVVQARTTAGIENASPLPGSTAADGGLLGGKYFVLIDPALGADTITWDTGGASPQTFSEPLILPSAPDPPGETVNITVTVSDAPDPLTAALTLTQSGVTYGPFPATVSQAAGGYALSAVFTADVQPGDATVQPGDILAGAFVPNGPAITRLLALSPPAADIALTAGPALSNIADPDSSYLPAGSAGFIHVRITAVNTKDSTPYDLSTGPVQIALLTAEDLGQENSQGNLYQEADWLLVTEPADVAGLYAVLFLSAASTLPPGSAFSVRVQAAGLTAASPGVFYTI